MKKKHPVFHDFYAIANSHLKFLNLNQKNCQLGFALEQTNCLSFRQSYEAEVSSQISEY